MSDTFQRTWDGEPISAEPPTGAAIVVYRRAGGAMEYLLLHRAHHGPAYDGDWAWGPPSGCRYPGEPVADCAARELLEETGLRLALAATDLGSTEWPLYLGQAPGAATIQLSAEHDRFLWLPLAAALARTAPEAVRASLLRAAGHMEQRANASGLDTSASCPRRRC
jgi:8-oxo-dGTP pyrophosphatase MutT (NUDIX family)